MNADRVKKIIVAIRAGNYMETAAAYAGISKETLYRWLKRGEKEASRVLEAKGKRQKTVLKTEMEFFTFYQGVQEAIASAEARDVAVISKAAAGGQEIKEVKERFDPVSGNVLERTIITKPVAPQWQASAWRLERKYPSRWGRRFAQPENEGKEETAKALCAAVQEMLQSQLGEDQEAQPVVLGPDGKPVETKPPESAADIKEDPGDKRPHLNLPDETPIEDEPGPC